MTIKTDHDAPPERPDDPGMRGTYGRTDHVESAQRSRLRKDQHYARRTGDVGEVPDPYGEGGFAGQGDVGGASRQSGYGSDFGQLEAAQRHEKHASERDYKNGGTGAKSNR
jgi:hypothetical protein